MCKEEKRVCSIEGERDGGRKTCGGEGQVQTPHRVLFESAFGEDNQAFVLAIHIRGHLG